LYSFHYELTLVVIMRLLFITWFFIVLSMTITTGQAEVKLLQFDEEIVHLGQVEKGTQVKSQFKFTNTSHEDVTIDFLSTCECTEAEWPSEAIKPGESGTIEFTFDTTKKDKEEAIDLDVILQNTDQDGNPYFYYLSYDYSFKK